jgi:hypothetical protein
MWIFQKPTRLVLALALLLAALASALGTPPQRARANDIAGYAIFRDTKMAAAGYGGMRGNGSGRITLSGVSGNVTNALLYWHGPTNSRDPLANATVSFAGKTITGTNIGFSNDNCWNFTNSQAYRADVTSLVQDNGSYALGGFLKSDADINGASLIVFYDDGHPATNRDVVLFDGNDSNIHNTYDADGWNVKLSGINYSTGTASLTLHVSDGQRGSGTTYSDDALVLNGKTLVPTSQIFSGDSVPNGPSATTTNGGLWDIKSYDTTSYLKRGKNTLTLKSGTANDCLSLVVAAIDLPAGAAPPTLPGARRPSTPDKPALVTVVQRPNPNMAAAHSSIVTYTIVAVNRGKGSAKETTITVPFDPAQVQVLDVTTSRPATWVSKLRTNSLEIKIGPLGSQGDTVTATLRLMTLPTVANGTSLGQRLSYHWSDDAGGGDGSSNLPVLTVGDSNTIQPLYPLAVAPGSAPAGATLTFSSPIFKPDEPVAFWYNTPDGKTIAAAQLFAQADGSAGLEFTTAGMAPGAYSMVAHGHWTDFTAVTTFQVQ